MIRYNNRSVKIKLIIISIGILFMFYVLFNLTLNYAYSTEFIFLFGVSAIAIVWIIGIIGVFYYFQKYLNIIKFNKIKSYYSGFSLLVVDLVIVSMLVFFLQSDASKFIKFSTSFVSMMASFCAMLVSIGIENYRLKNRANKRLQSYLINYRKYITKTKKDNDYKREIKEINKMCKYLDSIRNQSKIYIVIDNKKSMYNKPVNYMNHLNLNKKALSAKQR